VQRRGRKARVGLSTDQILQSQYFAEYNIVYHVKCITECEFDGIAVNLYYSHTEVMNLIQHKLNDAEVRPRDVTNYNLIRRRAACRIVGHTIIYHNNLIIGPQPMVRSTWEWLIGFGYLRERCVHEHDTTFIIHTSE